MENQELIKSYLPQVREWIRQDPDIETRNELLDLTFDALQGEEKAALEIEERFKERLTFGTAGIRGELAGGPNRMNRVLVIQTAAGFANFVKSRHTETNRRPTVVIGYDGRKNSKIFAIDSAEIFAGAGMRAIVLPRMMPTPVLAFAIRYLKADAGVMVTASHNPPRDNGYKVYLGGKNGGSQIISPDDKAIAEEIKKVAEGDIRNLKRSDAYDIAEESLIEAYVATTAALYPAPEAAKDVVWVYTPIHGVGSEILEKVVERAGFSAPHIVAEQRHPDPNFPTVKFPNPEELGTLDLAYKLATNVNADFIVSNDPDADRLAIAIPDTKSVNGWRLLTGNQVGMLLAGEAAKAAEGTPGAAIACSLVSTPGLASVAKKHNLNHIETLTGFKWVSRIPGLVYGFEESQGYLVNPQHLRDKDGISAALAFLDLFAKSKSRGVDTQGMLQENAEEYGNFASSQASIRVESISDLTHIMATLRSEPLNKVGDLEVAVADDLLEPTDGLNPDNTLRYYLSDGSRVIIRPSGTEPKLKVYLDVSADSEGEAYARLEILEVSVRNLLNKVLSKK